MKSDGQIVADTLAGNKDLFAEIVRRYEGQLKRVALSRIGRSDWADDVVQETFYWAYKCLGSYNAQYSFRTWLWTILLNQCHRHHQKHGRTPTVSSWSDQDQEAGHERPKAGLLDPSDALLEKERSELLHEQLALLTDDEADALRLRFFGELKFQEIADAMGCSLSCAKIRVRRGLTKISERLTTQTESGAAKPASNSELGDERDEL